MANESKNKLRKITPETAGAALMKLASSANSKLAVVAASNLKAATNSKLTKSVVSQLTSLAVNPASKPPRPIFVALPDHEAERKVSDWAVADLLLRFDEIAACTTDESEATKKLLALIDALKKTNEWIELTEHSKQNGHFHHLAPMLWEKLRKKAERGLKQQKGKSQK